MSRGLVSSVRRTRLDLLLCALSLVASATTQGCGKVAAPNDGAGAVDQLSESSPPDLAGDAGASRTNGEACSAASQCVSGKCSAGVCCDSSCTDVCKACNLPGKVGVCSVVPQATACRSNGTCDAAGRCSIGLEGSSCSGGLSCQGISCCRSTLVSGGQFMMGRSAAGTDGCPTGMTCDPHEQPEHPATVDSFYLDTFEVTVGRFRKFLQAYANAKPADGAGKHPLIDGSGWDGASWNGYLATSAGALQTKLACSPPYTYWTASAGSNEDKPINCVDWYTAFAFCAWDGGRLPTEAEWEYAATRGADNSLYPWGNTPPSAGVASYGCLFSGTSACDVADLPPVGSTPGGKSSFGPQDLSGSVWEWVLDLDTAYTTSCQNCANLSAGTLRVLRGSSFYNANTADLRASARYAYYPDQPLGDSGFRCARDIK